MHNFEKELDCCFRVDQPTAMWMETIDGKREKQKEDFEEYYVRAGENCIIHHACLSNAFCYVQINNHHFPYVLPLTDEEYAGDLEQFYDNVVKYANKFREVLMIYDYCLTELRKIEDVKEAVKSPLYEVKNALEYCINTGGLDVNFAKLGISKKLFDKLNARCKYLAYAGKLEWLGVISVATMKEFRSIEGLKKYVERNDLFNHPEGETPCKIDYICHPNFDAYDPLEEVRRRDLLERYETKSLLKKESPLKFSQQKLDEEIEMFYMFTCESDVLDQQLKNMDPCSIDYQKKNLELERTVRASKESAPHVPLINGVDFTLKIEEDFDKDL